MIGLTLTPRQTRTALDLLTGAVVVSVALALAGLTWRIAGHAGTGAVTVPSGQTAPAAPADIAPVLALAPFGKPAAGEASQPTSLPLELKGVFAANPASLSVAYIAVSGQAALPFRIGENAGGATVQGILRDRVILDNGGTIEFLAFPDPTLSPAQRAAAAAADPNQPAATAPATAQPASAPPPPAANPAQSTAAILQRFNATPADGGYKIGANGPPGLLPGDVLMSVNGSPLSDPNAAAAAYAAAQSSGSASVQLMRDGKRLTLTVPLR